MTFLRLFHVVNKLLDRLDGRGFWGNINSHRGSQQRFCQRNDSRGHGCREEQGLFLFRKLGYDPLDVMNKSHVEHPVRLVENEILHLIQMHVSLTHQVEQTPRGSNQNINTSLQHIHLRALFHAPEHNPVTNTGILGVIVNTLADLQGEFPGRRQDQRFNTLPFRILLAVLQKLDDRNGKRGGFARPGLRAT